MNISNAASNNTMAVNSKPHSMVNELQKQKNELTKQIQTVNEGTGDSKTKAEKVKAINVQIEELNKQIQEAQIEEKQKEIEEIQQKNAEKADDTQKEGVILSASLNSLLSAKNSYDDVKNLSRVRTKLMGEARVAEGQVKYGTGSVTYQMGTIAKGSDKISEIEGKMAKKMGEVDEKLNKAVQQGINEAQQERANEQDQVEGQEQEQKITSKEVDNNGEVQVTSVDVPVVDANRVIIKPENEKDATTEKNDKNSKSIDILA